MASDTVCSTDKSLEVRDIANECAEAIRSLNHATLPGAFDLNAPMIYGVVAAMSSATAGLNQLHRQLAETLLRRIEAGHLRHDEGGNTEDTAREAATQLQLAAAQLIDVHASINAAHNLLSHLADEGPSQ